MIFRTSVLNEKGAIPWNSLRQMYVYGFLLLCRYIYYVTCLSGFYKKRRLFGVAIILLGQVKNIFCSIYLEKITDSVAG